MAQATEKMPVLSQDAADQFDVYTSKRTSKCNAEATARRAKERMESALQAVRDEMGDSLLAKLPDGRTIVAKQNKRKRRAQPATEYDWWELSAIE